MTCTRPRVAVLLGALMSKLYPIRVAYAPKRMLLDKVPVVSSQLIPVSGIGSVIGPLIGSRLKRQFRPRRRFQPHGCGHAHPGPHRGPREYDLRIATTPGKIIRYSLTAGRGACARSRERIRRPIAVGPCIDPSFGGRCSKASAGLRRLRSRVSDSFNRASRVSRASRNACFERMRRDAWYSSAGPAHSRRI